MPLGSETKQLNAYLVGTGFSSPKAGVLLIFVSESSSQRLTVLKMYWLQNFNVGMCH